jgi:lipopolysaccharide/colanic/teichoic acid biosynthesis glycosyltransferase
MRPTISPVRGIVMRSVIRTARSRILVGFDIALAVLAPVIAHHSWGVEGLSQSAVLGFAIYMGISVAGLPLALYLNGAYRTFLTYFGIPDVIAIARAVVIVVGVAALSAFVIDRMLGLPRSVVVVHPLILVVGLVATRVLIRLGQFPRRSRIKARWHEVSNIVVIGTGPLAAFYIRAIGELGQSFTRVIGILCETPSDTGFSIHGCPILGSVTEAQAVFAKLKNHGLPVDRIVVAGTPDSMRPETRAAISRLSMKYGTEIEYLSITLEPAQRTAEPRPAVPLPAFRPIYAFAKRTFDIIGSATLILVLSPVFLVVAALVLLDVGRPLLFWQERPGRGGVPFRLYKFRTMATHAGPTGELIPDERRTTAVGGALRRTRVDELPQLFNVLCGQMSLVGPRPLLPLDLPKDNSERLSMRPGITGWAQVNGGRLASVTEKGALDLWYARNAGFWLDLWILLLTVRTVLQGERINPSALGQALDADGTQSSRSAA